MYLSSGVCLGHILHQKFGKFDLMDIILDIATNVFYLCLLEQDTWQFYPVNTTQHNEYFKKLCMCG